MARVHAAGDDEECLLRQAAVLGHDAKSASRGPPSQRRSRSVNARSDIGTSVSRGGALCRHSTWIGWNLAIAVLFSSRGHGDIDSHHAMAVSPAAPIRPHGWDGSSAGVVSRPRRSQSGGDADQTVPRVRTSSRILVDVSRQSTRVHPGRQRLLGTAERSGAFLHHVAVVSLIWFRTGMMFECGSSLRKRL